MSKSHGIFVALLRGINVGGNATVKMSELKDCFERLGYTQVRTYINSGNVVFAADTRDPRKLEQAIEVELEKHFGFQILVVVRSQMEIEMLFRHVPKSWSRPSNLRRNVIFLHHSVDNPTSTANLSARDGVGEEVHYYPGVLFWSAPTSNVGKSNMLKLIGTPIYKSMTIRTMPTVEKLLALLREAAAA